MAKSQRNLVLIVVPFAAALVWLAYGSGVFTQAVGAEKPAAADSQVRGKLEQAAESIVAAGKESVAAAQNDDDALHRAQLSLEALRIIGQLGDFDTDAQADKLMEEIRSGGHPAIVEAIIQIRLSSKLRQWDQLNDSARAAALDRFVADVKKAGLSPNHAKLLVSLANNFGDYDPSNLVSKAITELLPEARNSDDATIQRMTPVLEGIVRRLDLPGKPLELEGKLLDGTPLDWDSYRGKVVLVDFFASWCGPCRAEVPNVLANYRAYHDKGFEVIGINLDNERRLAEEYMTQTGFHFPTLFGAESTGGWDHPMARKYGITGIPRVMLVDQNGNVVTTLARGERLGQQLRKLLGPPSKSVDNRTGKSDATVIPAGELSTDGGVIQTSATEETSAPEPVPEEPLAPQPVPEK